MKQLQVLDLFSGIGGFSYGLEKTGGFKTAAFCEIEPFARRVLKKHWPDVPCHDDVRKLKGSDFDEPIDLICGGYPCQPFSNAGKRLGEQDDRHLWPEFARLIDELQPTWVIGENVAGHVSMGLDDVLADLEALGYTARPFIIPAVACDAKHRRDRIWTIAYADRTGSRDRSEVDAKSEGRQDADDAGSVRGVSDVADATELQRDVNRKDRQQDRRQVQQSGIGSGKIALADADKQPRRRGSQEERPIVDRKEPGDGSDVADTKRAGLQGVRSKRGSSRSSGLRGGARRHEEQAVSDDGRGRSEGPWPSLSGRTQPTWWQPEPGVGRVANGISNRVDRLRGLGNAVVPQVVEMIALAILEAHWSADYD